MAVKHIPAKEATVEVTVTMTKQEYEAISTNAAWDSGGGIERYLIDCALGKRRRGC